MHPEAHTTLLKFTGLPDFCLSRYLPNLPFWIGRVVAPQKARGYPGNSERRPTLARRVCIPGASPNLTSKYWPSAGENKSDSATNSASNLETPERTRDSQFNPAQCNQGQRHHHCSPPIIIIIIIITLSSHPSILVISASKPSPKWRESSLSPSATMRLWLSR